MTNIFLSVIIPTYNRSHYLIKILKILRNNLNNFNRFEVIIVDSFSKDSTNLKIKYFKNKTINEKRSRSRLKVIFHFLGPAVHAAMSIK